MYEQLYFKLLPMDHASEPLRTVNLEMVMPPPFPLLKKNHRHKRTSLGSGDCIGPGLRKTNILGQLICLGQLPSTLPTRT